MKTKLAAFILFALFAATVALVAGPDRGKHKGWEQGVGNPHAYGEPGREEHP
ncbi:MAG: hypothetical protein V4563_14520 [Pseudomonadota bacterium]